MELRSRRYSLHEDVVCKSKMDRKHRHKIEDKDHFSLHSTIRSLRSTLYSINCYVWTRESYLKAQSKRRRYRFSNSNRAKFQRKMSKASSPNLLSQSGPRYPCPHSNCDKVYKLEGAMKNHIAKIHGEESSLSESKFDPEETSTGHLISNEKKRKYDEISDTDDDLEDLEEAVKSKEARQEYVERLNMQRDYDLGFDITKTNDTLIEESVADTQVLLKKLVNTVEKIENQDMSMSVLAINDTMEIGTNNNAEMKSKDDKIRQLENIIHEKDTKLVDIQVTVSEMNDSMDGKDRKLKELRQIIKLKQTEISGLLKDKELNNIKLKHSPVKEALKAETIKAQKQIVNQANRIKNLEKQVVELERHVKVLEKDQPDVLKLKLSVKENLNRAEHYSREREELHNTIASLKKKIPCYNVATCDLGKRCQFSHVLRYSMQLNSGVKNIPCVHFIDNRCRFTDDECKFSHDEKHLNAKQRKQFMENRLLEDISEEEDEEYYRSDNMSAKYEAKAEKNRPPHSKKRRMTESSEASSYNSDATRFFPDPVPAVRRRSSTNDPPRRRSYNDSGNGQGARTQRSSQVSPQRRGGSQRGRRGSSGQRRAKSPASGRRSYQRSRSPPTPKLPKGARGRSLDNKRRSGRR